MKNGSTKVTRARWGSLDWEKQDAVLAAELGVTRERVRQVRKELGEPPSPSHRQHRNAPIRRIERCLKRRLASDNKMPSRPCLVARFNTTQNMLWRAGKNIGIEFASGRFLNVLPINWDLPDPALSRIWLKGLRYPKGGIAQHRYEQRIRRARWRLWKDRVVRGDERAYRVALKQEVVKRHTVKISQPGAGKNYCVSPRVA